jgi:TetR/AcrR family transcriptional repressor of nem operon
MRYSPEHKQQTRERIVRLASRRFRGRGEEGVAIADLMKELDLTHGGFYRHFDSKEDLFAEGIAMALEEGAQRMLAAAKANPGNELKGIIEKYLSPEHCERIAEGCPVAALTADVARRPHSLRLRFQKALEGYKNPLLVYIPGETEREKRHNFMILFSGMSGALSLARAMADEGKRQEILKTAREFYIRAFCS